MVIRLTAQIKMFSTQPQFCYWIPTEKPFIALHYEQNEINYLAQQPRSLKVTQTYLSILLSISLLKTHSPLSLPLPGYPSPDLHPATFYSFTKDYLKRHILHKILPVLLHLRAQNILHFSSGTHQIMLQVMILSLYLIGLSHHTLDIQIYDVLKEHPHKR